MTGAADGPGERDVQTVTPTGQSTIPTIHGVEVRTPPVHLDHRGAVYEVYNGDPELWPDPVVHAYVSTVLPRQIKGWARHEVKVDRYTLVAGELLMLFHDGRTDSPTHGMTQRLVLSTRGPRQVRIPVGVWHLLANVGSEEVHVLNLPTEPYHHHAPDRILLPWDTDELPVDVRAYLPKF